MIRNVTLPKLARNAPVPEIYGLDQFVGTPRWMHRVHAPFRPRRVMALNAYQTCGMFIPIKCPKCDKALVAKRRGLVCVPCKFKQEWARRYMVCLQRTLVNAPKE